MRVNFKAAIKNFKAYNKSYNSKKHFKTNAEMRNYICKRYLLATTNVGSGRHD